MGSVRIVPTRVKHRDGEEGFAVLHLFFEPVPDLEDCPHPTFAEDCFQYEPVFHGHAGVQILGTGGNVVWVLLACGGSGLFGGFFGHRVCRRGAES